HLGKGIRPHLARIYDEAVKQFKKHGATKEELARVDEPPEEARLASFDTSSLLVRHRDVPEPGEQFTTFHGTPRTVESAGPETFTSPRGTGPRRARMLAHERDANGGNYVRYEYWSPSQKKWVEQRRTADSVRMGIYHAHGAGEPPLPGVSAVEAVDSDSAEPLIANDEDAARTPGAGRLVRKGSGAMSGIQRIS